MFPNKQILRGYAENCAILCPSANYESSLRTYATQDVAAEVFGVGQATVSRSIEQVAPLVRQCIPIPAKIHDRARWVSTLEELEEILPGLRCLVDASEQPI